VGFVSGSMIYRNVGLARVACGLGSSPPSARSRRSGSDRVAVGFLDPDGVAAPGHRQPRRLG
jgi:hypothetical protein